MSKIQITGFNRDAKPNPSIPFRVGEVYNRRRDIHATYGGQQQSGISTPAECPYIFLFTGDSGKQHGYEDGWGKDGKFHYTGEGQAGDMQFLRGNKAIRDHVKNGKKLLLFGKLPNGDLKYEGTFRCDSWTQLPGKDATGTQRSIIQFRLTRLNP